MKRFCTLLGVFTIVLVMRCRAQVTTVAPVQSQTSSGPLKLIQTISLAGVDGALDHMAIDIRRQRLFVPAEQHETLEVVDLKSGKGIRTISEAR